MHACLSIMMARRQGAVINVASTAGILHMPYFSTYSASKAALLSLSESVHSEARQQGVRVLATCPGPTATQFFTRADMDAQKQGSMEDPREVAERSLLALEHGASRVVTSLEQSAKMALVSTFPRPVAGDLLAQFARPKRVDA